MRSGGGLCRVSITVSLTGYFRVGERSVTMGAIDYLHATYRRHCCSEFARRARCDGLGEISTVVITANCAAGRERDCDDGRVRREVSVIGFLKFLGFWRPLSVATMVAVGAGGWAAEKAAGAATPPRPLEWDALEKSVTPAVGVVETQFEFKASNRSSQTVEVIDARPSCGCTIVDLPETPWRLAPGAKGTLRAKVDFRGKHGMFRKTVQVHTSAGSQTLVLTVNIPEAGEAERRRNQELAAANRQAVFRGDCARCHAEPAAGKRGQELFFAVCTVCHLAPLRASMVPDLLEPKDSRDAAYWRKWIGEGKDGTLMPAFAAAQGGPLTGEQIESLVAFVLERLPTEPTKRP
jgi:mono/diheme cytochrome c family protein